MVLGCRPGAVAPPFANPEQLRKAKHVDWPAALTVCERLATESPSDMRLRFLWATALDKNKSYVEAARQYRTAADAGNLDASGALGVYYATGKGVIQNPQRAFELIEKAALAGDAASMGNLGVMYDRGLFVRADYVKAREWFEKSIEAGNSFALVNAAVLFLNGNGVDKDYDTAAQYFQQAADLDEGIALKYLAMMNERGLLGKQDLEKAGALRAKAALVDPTSQDPDWKDPPPAQRAAAQAQRGRPRVHYYVVRRYRFIGCGWVWC